MKAKKSFKSYVIDVVVMGLVAILVYSVMLFFTPVKPFHSITRVNIAPQRSNLIVSADYFEGDCTFTTLDVYGEIAGRSNSLSWESLDGYSNFSMDRRKGNSRLALKVNWEGKVPYDYITVVTQHYCSGKLIVKTFIRENLHDYIFYNPPLTKKHKEKFNDI
jgi:hypothetical protein